MLIQRWRNTVLNVTTPDWWIRIHLNIFFHTYRICIHISLTFFSSQFKGQTCYFCYLKVPFHLPVVENTQIGALYNLFHFMHDKIIHTEIIFRNNEPLILQNQTCLLEYDFIYCGTSIIFLRGRGCHMNAGRLVWLVCTNSPSRSWGWTMHQQPCMAYMLTQAYCSVAPTLPLCNCPLVYIFPLLCA